VAHFAKAEFDNMDQYTAWKDGKLVFENVPVDVILRALGRSFNATIRVRHGSSGGGCLLTTTFDPAPLHEILDLLCLTLNTQYVKDGEVYWIEGNGCGN
jgi:ferric-dicitrate binding protein FerR (iron transport regulator)